VRNCKLAGEYVKTKPGVTAGAVRQGLNTRFGDYPAGMDPGTYPPDENVKEDIDYKHAYTDAQKALDQNTTPSPTIYAPPNQGTGVRNRRVVLIPVIRLDQFNNGRDEVQIDHFAAFFMQTKVTGGNGGDFKVEYIEDRLVTGRGGFVPGGGEPSPELSIPVIYR
jgi:hypothetical protein